MKKYEIIYDNTEYLKKVRKFLGTYMAFTIDDNVEGEKIDYKTEYQLKGGKVFYEMADQTLVVYGPKGFL